MILQRLLNIYIATSKQLKNIGCINRNALLYHRATGKMHSHRDDETVVPAGHTDSPSTEKSYLHQLHARAWSIDQYNWFGPEQAADRNLAN